MPKATPGVNKASAIFSEDLLWGFYSAPQPIDEAIIRAVVGKRLPYYAVPSKFVFRETLPMTLNGKIDKRALLAWEKDHTSTLPPAKPKYTLTPQRGNRFHVTINEHDLSTVGTASQEREFPKPFLLPAKKGRHRLRALRHRIFSLYRRLFSVVFVANLLAAILVVRSGKTGKGMHNVSTAVSANLTMAVLIRQEVVINALFKIACSVPTSAPIWLRRNCAKIYHIGGIHSGCAVTRDQAVLTISYVLVALLIAMAGSAYPTLRRRYHDNFELIHRFAGWAVLILFWAQTVIVTNSLRGVKGIGSALLSNSNFWLLTITTSSIILPWLNLRKVAVRADVLSHHAVRLYFTYTKPPVGTAIKLTDRPLIEWHSFATITKPNEKEFSVLVSNAGDWTSRQIRTAPTKLWVRGVPVCGVLRIIPLFRSFVLVATGSGIGPCLPVIYAKQAPMRIFWSTPHPKEKFGSEVIAAVQEGDPNAVIHDTKTMGRPDMVAITYRLLRESAAEVVAIISNKKLTQMVVYAMESRGIPAFGAIFDS